MLTLYIPNRQDLWFRKEILAHKETMAYNKAWGGTISFSEDKWEAWYTKWLDQSGEKRFYRYLKDEESAAFVGEIAYHLDEEQGLFLTDVLIYHKYRGKGYGKKGLELLCEAAKANGLRFLYDEIARDNFSALALFKQQGFLERGPTDTAILVEKQL